MLTIAIWLALVAPCWSATVQEYYEEGYEHGPSGRGSVVAFVAAGGEVNDLAVHIDAAGTTLSDQGAVITPGPGCATIDPHTVRCDAGRFGGATLDASLGDGNDRLVAKLDCLCNVDAQAGEGDDVVRVDGQNNDDRLVGGPGRDALFGGSGTDVLRGGPGDDVLSGRAGFDTFSQGHDSDKGLDEIRGGPGHDTVDYRGLDASVTVRLPSGAVGPAAEPDHIASIEDAIGGRRPDVLIGTPGRNFLKGGWSPPGTAGDRIEGRGGPDELIGSPAADSIRGGAGVDEIVGDGGRDAAFGGSGNDWLFLSEEGRPAGTAHCGSGRDDVFVPQMSGERAPLVSGDCEHLATNDGSIWIEAARGVLRLTVPQASPGGLAYPGCRLTFRVTGSRRDRSEVVSAAHAGVAVFRLPHSAEASLRMKDSCNDFALEDRFIRVARLLL